MLTGKCVLLGVSGGIAAYKAVEVCSRLVKLGAEVRVVMTPAAARLVAPLTFQAISGHPVQTDLLAEQRHGHVDHVWLARRAHLLIVAPATAATLARLASGLAEDPVSAAALGVACPVLVAPAMEEHMWRHPATQANVARLRSYGYKVLEPATGRLASGLVGQGRLPEPEDIVQAALDLLAPRRDLAGRRVLVTAGPTREPLDPVRFISNRSSGKMGFAVAQAAADRGAEVVLVTGPVALPDPPGVAEVVRVETALQMFDAVMARQPWLEVAVATAAVADWRPAVYHPQKVKKHDGPMAVEFVRNPDILLELGRRKRPGQVLVGFKAETGEVAAHARRMLAEKNVDLVVANDVTEPGAGFAVDTNRVTLFWPDGRSEALPPMAKAGLAHALWDRVVPLLPPAPPAPGGGVATGSGAPGAGCGP